MSVVQHIAFNCADLRKQEAFYTKHFGFRRARVFNAGTPGEFVMLRLDGVCIELFSSPAGKGARAVQHPMGFKHLAFEVPDLDQALAGLRADGIRPGDVIDCSSIVPGMRVCFLDDPEGNCLELMQGYQDE